MDTQREVKRKLFHLLGGIILIVLVFYDLLNSFTLGIITVLAFATILIIKRVKIPFFEHMLDTFERPRDRMFFPGKGALLYLVGAELSLIFFEKNVAMFSILVLAVGDSVPMIINRVYKGSQHPFSDRRYIESAIVGVIICTVTGILFVRWYEALIASIAAIFIEGIDMKTGLEKVDDNLVIPVVSGLVIFLLRLFGLN